VASDYGTNKCLLSSAISREGFNLGCCFRSGASSLVLVGDPALLPPTTTKKKRKGIPFQVIITSTHDNNWGWQLAQ